MKRFIRAGLVLVILFFLSTLVSCTANPQKNDKKRLQILTNNDQTYKENQYIIHLAVIEDAESMIREDFNQFGIVAYKKIRSRMVLLEVNRDPGFDIIAEYCRGLLYIQSVQRNQIYKQLQKKSHPGTRLQLKARGQKSVTD